MARWHANPQHRFASRPDWVRDPNWRKGLTEVRDRGMVFELQVFPGQMADAVELAQAFPDLQIVLLHAGMLTDQQPATLEAWRPIVHDTLAWFGPDRCMFGSNFPVEKLWTDFPSLFRVFKTCIDHLSPAAQRAVLHDTAARIYRLG